MCIVSASQIIPLPYEYNFLCSTGPTCLVVRSSGNYSPVSPADTSDTLVSPTAAAFPYHKLEESPDQMIRLTDEYEDAYSDFYGSRTPYHIAATLDSLNVALTSINPLAYANAGEATPFCDFVVSVGVKPHCLVYDDAVVAGTAFHKIFVELGYPTIQVAFVESVVRRSGPGTKLPSFNPLLDDLPTLRMPFTPTLGLAIAPHKTPHYEGTGGIYICLSSETDDIALLTCAHVTRPPPAFKNNTGITWKEGTGKPREEIIALGTGAHENAVDAIMGLIGKQMNNIQVWEDAIKALPAPVDGESPKITKKRNEYSELITKAEATIGEANKIEVNVPPYNYTKDWGLVQLYREVIDWETFKGNKVWIGGNLTPTDWLNTMFPQPSDRKNYKYPPNGLLQARGVVPESELRNPTNLDVHNVRSLLCVKYGRTTRVRHEDSIEIAVLGYDAQSLKYRKFSDAGDSGAIVLGRDGRIVGIITGGAGPADETDLTYITPYHWLEKLLREKYPDSFLYDIVED
ncbi:hypothetical protein FRB90_005287 [Tulasnella sp. 427]|nr:hypothetical protein FRB90_005287 [Tulasnella sp. 427]